MEVTFRRATLADAALLVEIYDAAFFDDFVRYGECPGYGRTREKMEQSIARAPKYVICCGSAAVGAISWENRGQGWYFLGCLCVRPEWQGRGIGTQAFQFFLHACPDWQRIELVTPTDKMENIRFYTEKCGCIVGESENDGNVRVLHLWRSR